MTRARISRRGFAVAALLSFVAMVAAPQSGVICHEHPGGELPHSHPEDALFAAAPRRNSLSRELRDDTVLIVSSAGARRASLPLLAVLPAGDGQGLVAPGSRAAGRVVPALASHPESGVLATAEPPSSAHLHWQSPFHRVAPPRTPTLVVASRIVLLGTTADPAGPDVRLSVGRARAPPPLLLT